LLLGKSAGKKERTNIVKLLLITAGVCLLAGLTLTYTVHGQPASVDLTGTWQIDFHDDNGVSQSSPGLVLKQEADKLTGTFGKYDWPVIGAVDHNNVVFTFVAFGHEAGRQISDTVFYWGVIDNHGNLRGRMKNPKEAGDWIASRK
jgi:hypothetical protein